MSTGNCPPASASRTCNRPLPANQCRIANRNCGDLYFDQTEWKAARDAYRAAMHAGEQLDRAGLSAESKTTEMSENAALSRSATFAALRTGAQAEVVLGLLEQ